MTDPESSRRNSNHSLKHPLLQVYFISVRKKLVCFLIPRNGKTTAAQEIDDNMKKTALTNSAASHYLEPTIHSLLKMGLSVARLTDKKVCIHVIFCRSNYFSFSQKSLSPSDIQKIQNIFGAIRSLLIDECSMLTPVMLTLIFLRLELVFREMFKVALCGDFFQVRQFVSSLTYLIVLFFFQKPPIEDHLKAPSLPESLVLLEMGKLPTDNPVRLFSFFISW